MRGEVRDPRISVIVPAYDEAGNMPELFAELAATFAEHDLAAEVVLVDDGSGDGTAEAAEEAAARAGLGGGACFGIAQTGGRRRRHGRGGRPRRVPRPLRRGSAAFHGGDPALRGDAGRRLRPRRGPQGGTLREAFHVVRLQPARAGDLQGARSRSQLDEAFRAEVLTASGCGTTGTCP